MATGDSLRTIAFSYRMGHSTVYDIVINTCKVIVKRLMPEVMPQPTESKWKQIAADYWNLWNFPNCLGALDGRHMIIQAPPNSGSEFFNYKKSFSVVLLALVDAYYKFIIVDVGSFGKNSDGGILSHSEMGKALERKTFNVPPDENLPGTTIKAPYVIVGDEAFPLKTYLMRPYPGKQLDDNEKRIYNYRLCRARRVVENAFGILTQRFRIYQRRLQSKPENVDWIILATCVLHNYIRDSDENMINVSNDSVDRANADTTLQDFSARGGNATQQAFHVRDLYKNFFNSPIGSVPWQNEKC